MVLDGHRPQQPRGQQWRIGPIGLERRPTDSLFRPKHHFRSARISIYFAMLIYGKLFQSGHYTITPVILRSSHRSIGYAQLITPSKGASSRVLKFAGMYQGMLCTSRHQLASHQPYFAD